MIVIPKQLSNDEFVSRMAVINSEIEIISSYKKMSQKVECRCKIDGYEWYPLPGHLLRGSGCPKCKGRRISEIKSKPHDVFVKEIEEINPNIEILGHYKNCNTKIKCRCKIDGHVWYPFACNLRKGEGCPACGRRSQIAHATTSHEEFLSRMEKINPEIIIFGKYENNKSHVECECKKCGHRWSPAASDLLSGKGCPRCCLSHGERAISEYLSSRGIEHCIQKTFPDCKSQRKLPFDFYLPSLNTCIEYDGEQHYRPVNFGGVDDEVAEERFARTKTNDKIKNKYCQDHNIKLIRIPYWDFKDIALILDSKLIS